MSDFIVDSRSPYLLQPFDVSGAVITTTGFAGKNVHVLEKALVTALIAKNKVAFIDGNVAKPDMKKEGNPTQMNAWIIVNSMITSWILNVIERKLHASITYPD